MSPTFRTFADASAYSRHVGAFLMRREAENNLLLGIIDRLVTGEHDYLSPVLLGAVETEGDVQGCVWRTPPHKLGMTRLPVESIPAVVDAVADLYPDLEKVLGPVEAATSFAGAWSERKGVIFRTGMHEGIYQLDAVTMPGRAPHGFMRSAGEADLPLVEEWTRAFGEETGSPIPDAGANARRLLSNGDLCLWESDGRARSMVAAAGFTRNGVRVAYVYTPTDERRKGYASALVARFSQRMLDRGRSLCFLYADRANPTSTGIYRRMGYRLVAEAVDIEFLPDGRADHGGA